MNLTCTVAICTHDRPESLRRAVAAVLAQRRKPTELIIVNDGAAEVEASLAEQAARAGVAFRSVRQERPCLPAARNRGMDLANGDVVLLLDDDMVLPEDFLGDVLAIYQADAAGVIAGVGAVAVSTRPAGPGDRLWSIVTAAIGQQRWPPRRCKARSVTLPPALRARLRPARRLSGGTISLRRGVARTERFDERFSGYALGEDKEFCYRVGQRHALFLCPALRVRHESAPSGRPGRRAAGRMYVANTLHIAVAATGGGAGIFLLAGCELAGIALLHLAYLPFDLRGHAAYLAGMTEGLAGLLARSVRRSVCGC